eukprot:TRINITY_DN120803_c0_g1_i1.p1 TRINITY_DN120803_c0_g1~~TRINITY_DN120803_c0_g1_i1.p1  ORF type:complete len:1003 (+),score=312.29 TRINITY_DN120803_c0_g1_i1:119-3127(+)
MRVAPRLAGATLAVACSALLPLAGAIFEDEVGQYEWHVQHIGEPTVLAYNAQASAERVLVGSRVGVVASLALKDGTMQWRRVASKDPITVLRAGSKNVISGSSKGLVQSWKSAGGDLSWQKDYSQPLVDVLVVGKTKPSSVIVLESELDARSSAGKREWTLEAAKVLEGGRFRIATDFVEEAAAGKGSVCVVAASTSGASAAVVDVEAGTISKKSDLPGAAVSALASGSFLVMGSNLISIAGKTLSSTPLCGKGTSATFDLSALQASGAVSLLPWQQTGGVFAVSDDATTTIFGVEASALKKLRSFEGKAVVGPVFGVHEDEGVHQPVAVASVKDAGTLIQLLDPASGNVQPAVTADGYTLGDHGHAGLLLVRELSSGEHRTVITAADHSMAGIAGDKVIWSREEALASINHAFFYGRPHEVKKAVKEEDQSLGAQLASIPQMFVDLAKAPLDIITGVQEVLTTTLKRKHKQGSLITMMPGVKVPHNAEDLQAFGADKLILAVTRANKVFALEATTSEVIWQRYFGTDVISLREQCDKKSDEEAATLASGCAAWMRLADLASPVTAELLVVLPQKSGEQSRQVKWLDPRTGTTLHEELAPTSAGILSLTVLPHTRTSKRVLPLLLVDDARKTFTLPASSAEAAQTLEEKSDRLFHYEIDTVKSVVQGYKIQKTKEPALPLWNLELGSVGEKILASTSPAHGEWEHVPVYIKGDASILYKYLNKNLLAVASTDTLHAGNMSSLNLYAIDSITGHVLHQSRIVGGSAPVHMVSCDNWVLMHYWNVKKVRFEVTVMELFQAKTDDGPWNILFGPGSGNQTKSAHYLEPPVPLQQTYIFPTGVTSLGVTATLKGITPRSVMMALTTDQVFRVSKDVLNPRRPHVNPAGGAKSDDDSPAQFAPTKDEAIMPYSPKLDLRLTDVLSHVNPMVGIKGVVSSPTALESTSLVFSYGLDIFFTPVQTAKAYDVLSPGFNYKLLYLSVIAVISAHLITSYLASVKALKDRWK